MWPSGGADGDDGRRLSPAVSGPDTCWWALREDTELCPQMVPAREYILVLFFTLTLRYFLDLILVPLSSSSYICLRSFVNLMSSGWIGTVEAGDRVLRKEKE